MEDMEEGQIEFQEGTPVEEMPPPAEGEPAAEEVEEVEAAPAEESEIQEQPKKTAQDRINELTGKWRSTERDRDDWRDAYFKMQEQMGAPKEEPPSAPMPPLEPDMSDLPKPRWEDFQTEEDFRAAEIEYQAEKVYRKKELQRQAQVFQEQQRQEKARFDAWLEDGERKFPGFRQAARLQPKQGGPAISLEMDQAIRTDDLGHEIFNYLTKNVDESKRIASLPPIVQIREIGRLSAKLENQNTKPQPKTETKAPAVTRGATQGVEIPTKDPMKMSWKEYEAMRNKKLYG